MKKLNIILSSLFIGVSIPTLVITTSTSKVTINQEINKEATEMISVGEKLIQEIKQSGKEDLFKTKIEELKTDINNLKNGVKNKLPEAKLKESEVKITEIINKYKNFVNNGDNILQTISKIVNQSAGETKASFYWFYMDLYLNDYTTTLLASYINNTRQIILDGLDLTNTIVNNFIADEMPEILGLAFAVASITVSLMKLQWDAWNIDSYNKGKGVHIKMAGSGGLPVVVVGVSAQ